MPETCQKRAKVTAVAATVAQEHEAWTKQQTCGLREEQRANRGQQRKMQKGAKEWIEVKSLSAKKSTATASQQRVSWCYVSRDQVQASGHAMSKFPSFDSAAAVNIK